MSRQEVISPKLALALQKRIAELGTNPRVLATQIGRAYDHVRKVYNGSVFPGDHLLADICLSLELDYVEMHALVSADKGVAKGYEAALTGRHPWASRIEPLLPYLTDQDKAEVFALIKMKAEYQKNKGRC